MEKDTTSNQKLHSDHALLCLIGQKCRQDQLLDPLHQLVKIGFRPTFDTVGEPLAFN